MTVRGSVDEITGTEIRGWAYGGGRRDPVVVTAVLNHEILGEAEASLHRPDLAAAGFGDGNSGYAIKLFRPIDPLYVPFLSVTVDGGNVELPRAPMLGFGDFFRSLFAAHPAAGRPRSVFGGLWTDRTDAAAVLRGKLGIGQVVPRCEAALAQLIAGGYAVVDLHNLPTESPRRGAKAGGTGDVLADPGMLPLLKAVFEDMPVAVQVTQVQSGDMPLGQPSAANPSPAPAECLDVVVAAAEGASLDIVRNSHLLPEFTPRGASRWVSGFASDGVSLAAANGLLERHLLAPGHAVVIGPGTLYRVHCEGGASATRLLCVPARGVPLSLALDTSRREEVRAGGVRVWV